jgi:hypothetical protein
MWAIIGQVTLALLNLIIKTGANREAAQKQFDKILKRMDQLAKENASLKVRYDELKRSLETTPPKEPGI